MVVAYVLASIDIIEAVSFANSSSTQNRIRSRQHESQALVSLIKNVADQLCYIIWGIAFTCIKLRRKCSHQLYRQTFRKRTSLWFGHIKDIETSSKDSDKKHREKANVVDPENNDQFNKIVDMSILLQQSFVYEQVKEGLPMQAFGTWKQIGNS